MKNSKSFKEKIEYFLYEDDSFSATASKFLLMILALGGISFAGAVAPGLFKTTGRYRASYRYSKKQIYTAYNNLKRRKLIEITSEKNNQIKVRLANKGKVKIKEFLFDSLTIPKPKRWDKKWRIIIFDIPVNPKKLDRARRALREKIKELGFYRLQKSVWVYPYPCEDEILLVAKIFEVTKFIEIITAEKMLHESKLYAYFNL